MKNTLILLCLLLYQLLKNATHYPAASQTKGVVMLDQLITIDYHNRPFQYLEQLPDDYMGKILKIVKVVFQKD